MNNTDERTRATTKSALDSLLAKHTHQSRNIAISAGDFRVAVTQELNRILSERPGNELKAATAGLERLSEINAITAQEGKLLKEICDLVFSAQRRKVNSEEASTKIRAIYEKLLSDTNASHVALAIASIASSGPIRARTVRAARRERMVAAASRSNIVDAGMVGGAIGGAVIGGAIGGLGGAAIGAAIGGIAGGIGAACAT